MSQYSRDRVSSITKADLARAAGEWNTAVLHYAEALTRNPERPEIWVQYGHALKESGRSLDAEAAYRRAIEGEPASAEAHLQLGHVLKLQRRGDEAKTAYLRAFSLDPRLADAHRGLVELGLDDAQIAASRGALAPLPPRRRRRSRITLADRARELGQWAEAARLYREVLDRTPGNAPIWVQYGHMLRQLGDVPAAETAYRRALAYEPRNADSYLQLGHALKLQGKTEEAQSAYLRAFASDPASSQAVTELRELGWADTTTRELRRIPGYANDSALSPYTDVMTGYFAKNPLESISDEPRLAVEYANNDHNTYDTLLPSVAIISILYNKPHVAESFLEAICRQTYKGRIDVVFIDDASNSDAYDAEMRLINEFKTKRPKHVNWNIIRNYENLGNCASRNRGLNFVNSDIYIVIDADCLINKDFVSAHVHKHRSNLWDVAVGPLNLETRGREAWGLLEQLEQNPEQVLTEMSLQDPTQPTGFVNCITRNLSISRSVMQAVGGFNLAFGYSADPATGYGWEDVEFGYRLYAAGARIAFVGGAFSLHQSHASAISERQQVIGSATNFNKLLDQHREVAHVVRRWAADTVEKILSWAERAAVSHPELDRLRQRFSKSICEIAPLTAALRGEKKRLRIVSYRWHVPHQYEIYKLPHDFTLLTGAGTAFTNNWEYSQRPMRPNVKMLPISEYSPDKFDLAILHLDENVLCPHLYNNVLSPDWGDSFRWFLENVELPCIAVCHGTVPFKGQYGANPDPIDDFETIDEERRKLVEALRRATVVCNSHQAAEEWQFQNQRVIWHGIDPQEFPPGTHENGVMSHGVDRHRPHYRGAHELQRVMSLLGSDIPVASHAHQAPAGVSANDPQYADVSFRAWVDHCRSFKIYLNTTVRSPMPRSRTEAMMCGTIPVSLRNHDVDHFIVNGVNGMYGDTPEELADGVRFLLKNEKARVAMAHAARDTAVRVFNHDRFLTDWVVMLDQLGI